MFYPNRVLLQTKLIPILNELLNQTGRLRKGGEQLIFHCPFCSDKNLVTQKLEIAIDGPHIGNFHCWRCDSKGRTFGSLLKKLGASTHYRNKIYELTKDIKSIKTSCISKSKSPNELELPSEFKPLYEFTDTPEYKNAIFYLKNRGILLEDIYRYNIGYCEEGEYAHHIIVPSYDKHEKLNFFVGRRYFEDGMCPHKKPPVSMDIIGFENLINYKEPLNLVEGVFDAIAVRKNAIPLFGKFIHLNLKKSIIINKVKRINLILDLDALKDSIKNYEFLTKLGVEVSIIELPGKDPSKLGFRSINTLIKHSSPTQFMQLVNYKLKNL